MSYEQENKELLETMLEDTFFKDFSGDFNAKDRMFGGLELQLTAKCNLKCSYCYYSDKTGFGNELNDPKIATWSNIKKNADLIFEWLTRKKYYPKTLDIFSGDTLIHADGYYVIEKAIEFYEDAGLAGLIMIPSNMTFLKNPVLVKRVEALFAKAEAAGVTIGISASIDGKYADPLTRKPVADVDPYEYYSDDFYEDLFTFVKKYGCGIHPMMSHENIHVWQKNFDWFQGMFKKYDLPWNSPYMFEVRNDGWTDDTIKQYGEVYRYALDFSYNIIRNEDVFLTQFVFNAPPDKVDIRNMNLFNNISRIGRGIGCSLQTTLFVKLGDLTCNSCHRLSYNALNGFKFNVKDDRIDGIEPLNLPFYLATMSYDHEVSPYCETCLIKSICNGGCLGAQHEQGDAFTPIPSVCKVEHQKVYTQYKFLKDKGIFELFCGKVGVDAENTFMKIERLINE